MVSSAEQLNDPLRNNGLPIGSELGMDHLQSPAEACRWRLVSASPLIVGNNVEARVSTNMMRRRSGFAMTKGASDKLIALHSSECIYYLCIRLVQPSASFRNDMYYSQDVAGPSLRVVYRSCNVRRSETNLERASMQDSMLLRHHFIATWYAPNTSAPLQCAPSKTFGQVDKSVQNDLAVQKPLMTRVIFWSRLRDIITEYSAPDAQLTGPLSQVRSQGRDPTSAHLSARNIGAQALDWPKGGCLARMLQSA
jgi:hypothetical protein